MPTVVVIGGGFAGLAAASALVEADRDLSVLVLDAGDRLGGRVHTQERSGLGKVEFGATYFHGVLDNPVWDKANEGRVEGLQPEAKDIRWGFTLPGRDQILEGEEAKPYTAALKRFSDTIAACTTSSNAPAGEMTKGPSKGKEEGAQEASSTIGKRLLDELDLEDASEQELHAFRWHEMQLRLNTGAPCSRAVSSQWWSDYHELEGPNWALPGGFQAVAELMGKGLDVKLGHRAVEVDYKGSGVQVSCDNGIVLDADYVICTVSLGVLKAKHKDLFTPPLPPAHQEAIDSIGFGLVEKVFIQPNEAPKTPTRELPCTCYHLLWDLKFPNYPVGYMGKPQERSPKSPQELADNASGRAQSGRHATAPFTLDNANGALPDDMAALKPGTAQTLPFWATGAITLRYGGSDFKVPSSTLSGSSNKGAEPPSKKYTGKGDTVYGNSSGEMAFLAAHHKPQGLPVPPQEHHAAVVWLSGEHATAMGQASERALSDGILSLYDRFPAIPSPPGGRPEVHRSTWGTDDLFLGSYSYLDAEGTLEHVKQLGSSIDDKLFFAGEATCNEYMGTMHGAYISGCRAAHELLSKLTEA